MDIEPHHLEIVKKILKQHLLKKMTVWVFGSRASTAKKKFSDLDLAIDTHDKISFSTMAAIQTAFSESDLPYKVDIIDVQNVEENFLNSIKKSFVKIDL